jgi:hypothetical protein
MNIPANYCFLIERPLCSIYLGRHHIDYLAASSTSSLKMRYLSNLPNEIILVILSTLPARDILAFAAVGSLKVLQCLALNIDLVDKP